MTVIQFGQIFPVYPPRSGDFNLTLGAPYQPLGMGFVKGGRPTGMINGDIDKYSGIALMNRVYQFNELFQGGGAGIKLRQGRIDGGKA